MADCQKLPYETHCKLHQLATADPSLSNRKLGKLLGIHYGTVGHYRDMIPVQPDSGNATAATPSAETNDMTADSWKITLPKTRIHTLEELVAYCEIDLDVWEVERFVCNKWEVGAKVGPKEDSRVQVTPLFQIKAFLKKRKVVADAQRIIDRLCQRLEKASYKPPALSKSVRREKSGNIVEISPVDVHHGALVWGKETGGADWDLGISERTYKDAFSSLVERTDSFHPEGAMIVLGHDQQNADNRAGMTENGTQQNNDGRYQKVADVSLECSIWAIDLAFAHYGKVEVFMVPGNHDPLSTWHLGRVLIAYYRNNPAVVIHNSPNPRQYWEHGVNMLLLTHGNAAKGKLERYPGIMAAEQREMWGRTKWHEAHTGDRHHRRLIELAGATVRILPSLRPPCAWSAENLFLGSVRAAEAYVWSASEGLIGTSCFSILDK